MKLNKVIIHEWMKFTKNTLSSTAERAGMHYNTLWRALNTDESATLKTVEPLAKLMGVDYTELLLP